MPNSIRLGLMPPLTGLVQMYGPEIVWAARIACEEINERGGVLGRVLKLVVEDDGSMPATAVPAAQRLVREHGCVALIGNLLSNSRIAVAQQIAEPWHVPYLNFSFYEGSITGRYFFHFAALPNQQIDRMLPYMAERFGRKMFFAGNNYEWPRGSIDAAKRTLQAIQGDVLGEEYLPIGASSAEIDRLLDQLACSGADVFVPYFAGSDQITLLTRFAELGLKERMAVVMGHYDEMMVSHLSPEVRAGFYSSNTYFMSLQTPENQNYLQRLARQPGVQGIWPHGNGILTNFGEGAYLCVHAFANAARAAGSVEPQALVGALEQVRVRGPQGLVEMDARTHHAKVNTCLACCNPDGSFRVVQGFGAIAPDIPARYRADDAMSVPTQTAAAPELSARLAQELGEVPQYAGVAQQILAVADVAIVVTDESGTIAHANHGACEMFGYEDGALLGLPVHFLLPPNMRARHAEMLRQFVQSPDRERRMASRADVMGYRKDGSFFHLEASIAKFRGEDDEWLLVVSLHDISVRKRAEQELTRRATHDTLTGLPNRSLIRERLASALQRSRRDGTSVATLFIDLDGFKQINDTHGHEIGDSVLKTVANRMLEQVRPGDTVARLAGDEFVVLCEQVEQPATLSVLAQRLNDALRQPVRLGSLDLMVSASIGVAIGDGHTHHADDLLRFADTAMYAVKQKGRDGWQFFSEGLDEQARERLAITNGLRLAIANQELSPRFQPIVASDSGRIVGAELLLRWHPAGGEVAPAVFIPVAEMTGAILPIGAWVFREACRAQAQWTALWGELAPYVSLNLSTRQLGEASLVQDCAAVLRETGADPARMLLEITETALMTDIASHVRVLHDLASLGLRLAVDDFGTGYSSLAQLTRLPVDVLKIDRAFIDGIDNEDDVNSRTVIRAIIGLGKSLGLKLVAEGVETSAQCREIGVLGCDFIQGYYFYRPLDGAGFKEAVAAQLQAKLPGSASPLFFLIYVSRARTALSNQDLADILVEARSFNRSNGITGALIYQDGMFMQMLEGSQQKVLDLMDHIRCDPRHADVRIVMEQTVRRRVFGNWSMLLRNENVASTVQDEPDFRPWQRRSIDFAELADDARTCYSYITALAGSGISR